MDRRRLVRCGSHTYIRHDNRQKQRKRTTFAERVRHNTVPSDCRCNFYTRYMIDPAESRQLSTGAYDFPMLHYLSNLFSQVLARVAVPMFFFMSGYLFFYKTGTFDKSVYRYKLKRRCKSLLIPYLFWNLLWASVYAAFANFPATSKFFANPDSLTFNFELLKRALIGADDPVSVHPIVYPFWFIRDLIVCVIISPILHFIVSKTRWTGIALLGLAWFLRLRIPYIGIRGFSTFALFFFSAGAWFSVRAIDVVDRVKNFKIILVLYPICAAADLLAKDTAYSLYIHSAGILAGIVFWLVLTATMLEKNWIRPVPFLSSASFFIFAVHEPWLLSPLKRAVFAPYIQKAGDFELCAIYFMTAAAVTVLGLAIYAILKRLFPRFTAIITGGR